MIRDVRKAVGFRGSSALLTILLVAGLTAGVGRAEEVVHHTLQVGEKAPLFKSMTIDGQPFDLQEQLSKKNIVLFFWSFFCGPCREEMPQIQQLSLQLQDKAVAIAGVNLDEPALHTPIKNFLKSSALSFPIVVNKYGTEDAHLDKLFLVTGTPTVYMIRQDGSISFAFVGRMEEAELAKAVQEHLLAPPK